MTSKIGKIEKLGMITYIADRIKQPDGSFFINEQERLPYLPEVIDKLNKVIEAVNSINESLKGGENK